MVELEIHGADGDVARMQIAAAGSRSYAFLIDWHIRLVLAIAWWLLGTGAMALLTTGDFWETLFDLDTAYVFVVLLPALAIYLLYHPVLEVMMAGRTPGKRMAGVRVVDRQGRTPGIGALLSRNLFRLIDSIPGLYMVGLLSVMLTRQHLRIGDLAAGTILVYEGNINAGDRAMLSSMAADSDVDPALRELVLDLIARWPALQTQRRSELARTLLQRLPADPGDAKPLENNDNALLEQLKRHV